jgi:hypothetical protein
VNGYQAVFDFILAERSPGSGELDHGTRRQRS